VQQTARRQTAEEGRVATADAYHGTEGAILPRDLLARVDVGDEDFGGITPDAYHLSGEKLNEAASRAWNRLQGLLTFPKGDGPASPEACHGRGVLDSGTSSTRERLLLPLFQELGYGRAGAAQAGPHSLLQEFLNRSDGHLWGSSPTDSVCASSVTAAA